MAHYSSSSSSVRARFEKMIREAQDPVCTALDAADGWANFKEDVWSRPGGGGGISRVLQDKAIWKKAGVNVSVIYGIMPPEAYRAAKAAASPDQKPGPIPFFTAGISSVGEANIQESLDRAVAIITWKEAFLEGVVKHFQRYRSDHCPILIDVHGESLKRKRPYIWGAKHCKNGEKRNLGNFRNK
ncbi:oxygen-dependent coproporphyrinogen-III oxidase, chloroplastic-like [Arachis duranensis]|uniref:coproporphyrinogen oxidase n=1 Tax=Arachis duranensis TaxID=130453 RepID=A0A9C6WQ98_ARADU|nr:oxygen-dependent coproporphyrinogen-III oxidase, chloroplastic-like [Arachis duranensis]